MVFDFFYDGQIRRFLLQVVRAFAGFQYESGLDANNQPVLKQVPCHMATQNRQVGHIMRNLSENTVMSCPQITVFIRNVEQNRDLTQSPSHISKVQVWEREYDPQTGQYTGNPGNKYTVERKMPHPLLLNVQIDVWTSNELQKHQLFEQIYSAFHTGINIQNSDNPLDWTALTTMELKDMNWSSRAIPIGTNDEIDVMSFTFEIPMWITPPAKVKEQKLIQQIVTNIHSSNLADKTNVEEEHLDHYGPQGFQDATLLSQSIITPGNYKVAIEGSEITLLNPDESETNPDGSLLSWKSLIDQYGTIKPVSSMLRLRSVIDVEDVKLDIVGYINYHPTKPNVLEWQVSLDSLPANTQNPIKGIIDPLRTFPGSGLATPNDGDRYLVLNDIGEGSMAWGSLSCHSGDVIQYAGSRWVVAFDAQNITRITPDAIHYILNLASGKQLKFVSGEWIMAIDGVYNAGHWRLDL